MIIIIIINNNNNNNNNNIVWHAVSAVASESETGA